MRAAAGVGSVSALAGDTAIAGTRVPVISASAVTKRRMKYAQGLYSVGFYAMEAVTVPV